MHAVGPDLQDAVARQDLDRLVAEQLVEMDAEVLRQRAGDMPLEQQRERNSGDSQGNRDRRGASGNQPQPQRVGGHRADSGTR